MQLDKHPIYQAIYDLCQEIEKLPASDQATKIVIMAGNLQYPADKILDDSATLERENIQLKAEVERLKSNLTMVDNRREELASPNHQLSLEVEDFKNNNRYHRGYSHGERDEKKRTDQWRAVAEGLAVTLKDTMGHISGSHPHWVTGYRALCQIDKLNGENDPGMKLRTRKGA